MHDLVKLFSFALASAIGAVAAASSGAAQDALKAPSFDCKKASTADEKGICENFSVAWLDRQLARAWTDALQRVGAQGQGQLRSSQSAWLASRRGCGADGPCLLDQYMARLRALTSAASQVAVNTGTFAYGKGDYSGSLRLVHHGDDTMAGTIETVSGPSFHLCNISFEGAERIGQHHLWTGPRADADFEGRLCRILIQPLPGGDVRVDSVGCAGYCGARGRFDSLYKGG